MAAAPVRRAANTHTFDGYASWFESAILRRVEYFKVAIKATMKPCIKPEKALERRDAERLGARDALIHARRPSEDSINRRRVAVFV